MSNESALLPTGERVYINDHVYAAAPWNMRDSNLAYSIGRVLEFLPALGELKGKRGPYSRVRLAWYYRTGDLNERSTDSRLLLAAIYSEIQPITYIRGKCNVRHRDMISNLAAWKKQPDCFYFYRYFDAYIKREYEVLLSRDLNNLPLQVKSTLTERYQFVIAEKEIVPDLVDVLRTCDTCGEWCSPSDAVRCDSCKNYYHMSCVQPPLAAKPAKGYGWSCAPCTKKHEDSVDRQGARSESPPRHMKSKSKPKSAASAPQPPPAIVDVDKEKVRYFKMWPYRYFGLYTDAYDTLDPDDSIFPSIPTRVGPKYQALCPPILAHSPTEIPSAGEIQRGGDETIELLNSLCHLSEDDAKSAEYYKNRLWHKPEQKHLVDFLDEAVRRFSNTTPPDFPNVRMKGVTRPRKWSDQESRYYDREWTEDEAKAFDQSIRHHGGAEMRLIQKDVKTRTVYEVVRYYGRWKNEQLKKHRASENLSKPSSKSSLQRASGQFAESIEDDAESTIDIPKMPSSAVARLACGSCKTKESQYWWKAPKGSDLSSHVLCDQCGMLWRKYADLKTGRNEENGKAKVADKREGTVIAGPVTKRIKLDATEDTGSVKPQRVCLCCKRSGLHHLVLSCQQCGVTVHPGCAGAAPQTSNDSWRCELCDNERAAELAMDPRCLMCSSEFQEDVASDFSYLRICKPTENGGWVHVLCAVFCSDIQFTDASSLRRVEGLGSVPEPKRIETCVLCRKSGGVTLKCIDTNESVHVSCSWLAGFTVGFEIQSGKGRKDGPITIFKNETGILTPVVSRKPRRVFGLCEMDAGGETVLQQYCRCYKQAPQDHSYGLLRKAQRMDALIQLPVVKKSTPKTVCCDCGTQYTPLWWPCAAGSMCSRCWAQQRQHVA